MCMYGVFALALICACGEFEALSFLANNINVETLTVTIIHDTSISRACSDLFS